MCGCKDNWTADIVLWPVMYPCFACQTKSMLFVPISLFLSLSLSLSLSFSLLCALSKTLVLPKLWGRKLVGEGANTFFEKISTPIFQFNHPQTVLTDRTLQVKSNCQNVKGQKKPNALQLRQRSPTVVTSVVTQLWVLLPWTHTCWVTVVKGPLSALCVDIPANRWDTSKRTCWFIQAKDHSTVPNVTKPSRHLRSSSGTF